jgi:hypothetical protein
MYVIPYENKDREMGSGEVTPVEVLCSCWGCFQLQTTSKRIDWSTVVTGCAQSAKSFVRFGNVINMVVAVLPKIFIGSGKRE